MSAIGNCFWGYLRTRFDSMVNQFVLEAFTKEYLELYQGDFQALIRPPQDVAQGDDLRNECST